MQDARINRGSSCSLLIAVSLLGLVRVTAPVHAASPAIDWSATATSDLTSMHDLIRDNHPGPVDDRNPGFKNWLESGASSLRAQAREARTEHDYRLILMTYANGFADYHLAVQFNQPEHQLWPGFLTRTDTIGGPTRVVLTNDAPGVEPGDMLLGCGVTDASDLLTMRVLRPLTNPTQPQRLILTSPLLTVVSADDHEDQTPSCRFSTVAGPRAIPMHWRPIGETSLSHRIEQATGIVVPPLGLRRVGDVWLISLPSFTWNGADAARMRALVATVRDHAPELHAARHVVIDLRGNGGGNSQWGEDVAASLWGKGLVDALEASGDGTVDWRVSPRNRDTIRAEAAEMRADGHSDEAADWEGLARRMDQAVIARQSLMRVNDAPSAAAAAATGSSPFARRVFVLTDPHCASACLDFVDLLNQLPATQRIGLPTGADTDYLDLAFASLPSGRAKLAYAMKVYRHRPRGSNVAYQPVIPWPGGTMTDASIARWLNRIPGG